MTPNLPNSLGIFNCFGTYIPYLEMLPDNLMDLNCGNNSYKPRSWDIEPCIKHISNIPRSLVIFRCDYNNLSELPELIDSLKIFDCRGNPIKYITPHNYEIIKS